MRLTAELIEQSAQYTNQATNDREISFRDYKINEIENLGATLDQFDCIDFTDNDLRKLDNFPQLLRLKKLLLSNNRIQKIADNLAEQLPNLEWLILTNNSIEQLGDVDSLASLTKLECLCLLDNPVTTKQHYRLYVIHKLPKVRLLDFRRIKLREREEAKALFKGKKGRQLEKEIGVKSKFASKESNQNKQPTIKQLSAQEIEAIKSAIAKASTLEEVERLNQILKSGQIPGNLNLNNEQNNEENNENSDVLMN